MVYFTILYRSERYLGMWLDDKYHGPGILVAGDKSYYSGTFANGEKSVRMDEATLLHNLIPRPHPAFRCLQYSKVGRGWYLFSREHDAIRKWQKFDELIGCVLRIFNQLRTQHSVCKTIASR